MLNESPFHKYSWVRKMGKKTWVKELCCDHRLVSYDYFVVVKGVWVPTTTYFHIFFGIFLLNVGLKEMSWSYIIGLVTRWHGELELLVDFNEVSIYAEWYRSVFYNNQTNIVNDFAIDVDLITVLLGDTPLLGRISGLPKWAILSIFWILVALWIFFQFLSLHIASSTYYLKWVSVDNGPYLSICFILGFLKMICRIWLKTYGRMMAVVWVLSLVYLNFESLYQIPNP